MERKIGEIFEYNGEWYQCVKSDDTCNGCIGKFQPYSFCHGFEKCAGKIFKKLEKVEEPYEHCGKLYQCYKLPMEIEIRLLPNNCNPIGKDNLVEIEIKQNKEDMEEKKIQHYDCFFDRKSSKSDLKPFDLVAAKAGKPVCTRDGRKARIICFDREDEQPIVALIKNDEREYVDIYFDNGHSVSKTIEVAGDLMMLPEKKEGWVNIYDDMPIYDTKEEALNRRTKAREYIDTIKIIWEE